MQKLIDFRQKHNTIVGCTGSGKSYATTKSLARQSVPVLYYNTVLVDENKLSSEFCREFYQVDSRYCWDDLEKGLKRGKKLNFLPPIAMDAKEGILTTIIKKLFASGFSESRPVYLVVDEVHLFTKVALRNIEMISTSGRSSGIFLQAISQRPAKISNTIMTQSEQFILFETHMEEKYFASYKIPIDEVQARLKNGGQYSYCTYDFKEINGAFRV